MEIRFLYYIVAAIFNFVLSKFTSTLLWEAWEIIFFFIGFRKQINHKTNLRMQRSRNYQIWRNYCVPRLR